MTKNTNKRYGFHSIESIINNNPHTIKKLFIPSSRDDNRIHQLISLAEKFEIKYEISNKLKKDHEAIVAYSEIRSFKDLPDNAKRYIHALEDFVEAKISSISTSPEREDTILVEDPFNN